MHTVKFVIESGAKRWPQKIASRFENRSYTYHQLNERAGIIANYLFELGLRKGETATILSENCHEYIEVIAGAAKGGFILCTLNYMLTVDELAYIINDAGATVVFFDNQFASKIESLKEVCPCLKSFIAWGQGKKPKDTKTLDYENLFREPCSTQYDPSVEEDDTLLLVYTSGTTGRPKGVMLSQKNVFFDGQYAALGLELTHETINLNIAPLFHVASTILQTMSTLIMGGTNVTLRRFETRKVLETIEKERITWTFLVPTMIYRLLDEPEIKRYDLSSLRHVAYGAAPIFRNRLEIALEIFGPVLYGVYGLTEGTANITILRAEDHLLEGPPEKVRRLNSCGREHNGHEVRVVDFSGFDVAPGEIGEVIIRSAVVMQGYWNNPKATQETIRSGWLYTGDLATIDEEHYIFIVDRKKNMIISGGENIYPKEIEDVIIQHDSVANVCVFGVRDSEWGESPKAVVECRPGMSLNEEEVIAFAKEHLARYKCIRHVEIIPELPKNSVGKVDIKEIKKRFGDN